MECKCVILLAIFFASKCFAFPKGTVLAPMETVNVTEENVALLKDIVKRPTVKTVTDERKVYLEDVLYNLNQQNWTAEEEPCLNQTLLMLKSLQNFTLWAVWEWDSITSEPLGLLYGNLFHLGNYDECLGTPWTRSHPELATKYCIADIELKSDKAVRWNDDSSPYSSALNYLQTPRLDSRPLNKLRWGVCVPKVCGSESVKRLTSVLLARSHLGTAGEIPTINVAQKCQTAEPLPFDGLFFGFLILVSVLVLVALICTYLNRDRRDDDQRLRMSILNAFCLKSNAKNLLVVHKNGLEVLYGVRFLSICVIVLSHTFGLRVQSALTNGLYVDNAIKTSIFTLFVSHNDLAVDSFFVLSSFLFTVSVMKMQKMANPFLFILRRYVRLIVAYMIVVFFLSAAFPYIGDGPLWSDVVKAESAPCRSSWWTNLLMINNYKTDEICHIVTWYIPCDFHYFVISVSLFWLHRYLPRTTYVIGGVITVLSILVPGVVNYVNQFSAVQIFDYNFLSNIALNPQFLLFYTKSHTRCASYIVGLFAGLIYHKYKTAGSIQLSMQRSKIIAFFGLAVMFIVLIAGPLLNRLHLSNLENAIYAAFNRPVWSAGLTLFILTCAFGKVPLVKSFLSWYPWVPLSRLAYGVYLTHIIFIQRTNGVVRSSVHFDKFGLFVDCIGYIFFSTLAALLLWLFAEAPANNLLVLILTPRRNQINSQQSSSDQIPVKEHETKSHLRENMSSKNLQLFSKF